MFGKKAREGEFVYEGVKEATARMLSALRREQPDLSVDLPEWLTEGAAMAGREAARRGVPRRPAIAFGWFLVLRGLNEKYPTEAFENEMTKPDFERKPKQIRGHMSRRVWIAIAIVVLVVVWLRGGFDEGADESGSVSSDAVTMTRSDLGAGWPLTVEEGVVSCEGGGEVYFTAEGTTYAVNGLAQGNSDLPDIDAIWADDPNGGGLKINIGPIIDRGASTLLILKPQPHRPVTHRCPVMRTHAADTKRKLKNSTRSASAPCCEFCMPLPGRNRRPARSFV